MTSRYTHHNLVIPWDFITNIDQQQNIGQGKSYWPSGPYICNFLLAINSNFERISYRFRDIDAFISKLAWFPSPPSFDAH